MKGNTILITGGTSGIGLALAELFVARKNKVLITGRSPERLKKASEKGLIAISCDMNDPNALDALAVTIQNDYPELNVLINNAGIQYNYRIEKETPSFDQVYKEITTNTIAPIRLTQLLLPLLMTKPSSIINITSALGAVPKPDGVVYAASKAALRNFTEGLRMVLKKTEVTVIEVIPPVVDTPMTKKRDEKKMQVIDFAELVMVQLEKNKKLVTVVKIRFLLWLNRFFPAIARSIIDK